MNNCLVISGIALYLFAFVFIALILSVIYFANAYFYEKRKCENLSLKNKKLAEKCERLREECFKVNFKVPEIGNDAKKATKRGGKNV